MDERRYLELYFYLSSGWVAYNDLELTRVDASTPVVRQYYYAGDPRVAMNVSGEVKAGKNGLFY